MALMCSVVIVSYRRETILKETVTLLSPIVENKAEIIVINQKAPDEVYEFFEKFANVRYFNLEKPGMVGARNFGILQANYEIVLFLDDDIEPLEGLIDGHLLAYEDTSVGGVAGRIFELDDKDLQTLDHRASDLEQWHEFIHFNHDNRMDIITARGCNMSFRREILMSLGGFDTNIKHFRDDSEMSFRVRSNGYRILFEPNAALIHFSTEAGGTRISSNNKNFFSTEIDSYWRIFWHCRDDLYFWIKHYKGMLMWKHIWRSYSTHIGLSRFPWRWFARFTFCTVALIQAFYQCNFSHPPYFQNIKILDSK